MLMEFIIILKELLIIAGMIFCRLKDCLKRFLGIFRESRLLIAVMRFARYRFFIIMKFFIDLVRVAFLGYHFAFSITNSSNSAISRLYHSPPGSN
jgi:hypothetical protein